MGQLPGGARYVNAFLNVTNSHVRFVEWKATQLTTFWQEVRAVTIMNQTFNVFVPGVIHQKAALTVQTLKQAHFLAAQGHP
jgi:hypothetical protein